MAPSCVMQSPTGWLCKIAFLLIFIFKPFHFKSRNAYGVVPKVLKSRNLFVNIKIHSKKNRLVYLKLCNQLTVIRHISIHTRLDPNLALWKQNALPLMQGEVLIFANSLSWCGPSPCSDGIVFEGGDGDLAWKSRKVLLHRQNSTGGV